MNALFRYLIECTLFLSCCSEVSGPAATEPTRLESIPDGNELWFTRSVSGMGYFGPAIFRSVRTGGVWGEPVETVSNHVGDPGIDAQGNLYLTHLFYSAEHNKIEADIYVAYGVL